MVRTYCLEFPSIIFTIKSGRNLLKMPIPKLKVFLVRFITHKQKYIIYSRGWNDNVTLEDIKIVVNTDYYKIKRTIIPD